ncbi:hypothetical protein TB9_23045, partial [Xanthomonas perforans]
MLLFLERVAIGYSGGDNDADRDAQLFGVFADSVVQWNGQVEAETFAIQLAIDPAGHKGGGLKQKFFHEVLHKHSPAESGALCIAVNRFHLLRGHVRDN